MEQLRGSKTSERVENSHTRTISNTNRSSRGAETCYQNAEFCLMEEFCPFRINKDIGIVIKLAYCSKSYVIWNTTCKTTVDKAIIFR